MSRTRGGGKTTYRTINDRQGKALAEILFGDGLSRCHKSTYNMLVERGFLDWRGPTNYQAKLSRAGIHALSDYILSRKENR